MFTKKAVAVEPDEDDAAGRPRTAAAAGKKKPGKKPPTRVVPQWQQIGNTMLASRPGAR